MPTLMHFPRIFFLTAALAATAANSLHAQPRAEPPIPAVPPQRQLYQLASPGWANTQFAVPDPAEGVNRRIYKFNAKFDDYVFLPVVNTYKTVVPEFARTGVTNFFRNLGEFGNTTNSVLQAKPGKAATSIGRFALNSTVGVLGLFDVATPLGLERVNEDFGQTLGHWGVGTGPYVMLPLLGPSSVRDTTGIVVDALTFSWAVPGGIEGDPAYQIGTYGVKPVDARATNNFRYHSTGSPFEYELIRYISAESRRLQVDK